MKRQETWIGLALIAGAISFLHSQSFGLHGIALLSSTLTTFVVIMVSVIVGMAAVRIYLMPANIALKRGHHNSTAIFVLNALLGWTLIGWAIAFAWSLTVPAPVPRS